MLKTEQYEQQATAEKTDHYALVHSDDEMDDADADACVADFVAKMKSMNRGASVAPENAEKKVASSRNRRSLVESRTAAQNKVRRASYVTVESIRSSSDDGSRRRMSTTSYSTVASMHFGASTVSSTYTPASDESGLAPPIRRSSVHRRTSVGRGSIIKRGSILSDLTDTSYLDLAVCAELPDARGRAAVDDIPLILEHGSENSKGPCINAIAKNNSSSSEGFSRLMLEPMREIQCKEESSRCGSESFRSDINDELRGKGASRKRFLSFKKMLRPKETERALTGEQNNRMSIKGSIRRSVRMSVGRVSFRRGSKDYGVIDTDKTRDIRKEPSRGIAKTMRRLSVSTILRSSTSTTETETNE